MGSSKLSRLLRLSRLESERPQLLGRLSRMLWRLPRLLRRLGRQLTLPWLLRGLGRQLWLLRVLRLLRRLLGCHLRLSWLLGRRIRRSHGCTNSGSRNGAAAQRRKRRTGSTKERNQPRQQGTSHCANGARCPTH